MKNLPANIFHFSRQERKGIIAMIVLLLFLIAANSFLYLIVSPKQPVLNVSNLKALDTLPKFSGGKQSAESTTVTTGYPKTAKQNDTAVPVIDLNMADSLALVSLNGIGPVFAARIIKYRTILGGFCNKEQLKEVYGFDEEKYNSVAPYISTKGPVTQININTCTFKELNRHPYIEYDVTKAIFNLKKKLGKFQSVEEIKQVDLVSEELYNKIAPYLTTQ